MQGECCELALSPSTVSPQSCACRVFKMRPLCCCLLLLEFFNPCFAGLFFFPLSSDLFIYSNLPLALIIATYLATIRYEDNHRIFVFFSFSFKKSATFDRRPQSSYQSTIIYHTKKQRKGLSCMLVGVTLSHSTHPTKTSCLPQQWKEQHSK